MRREALRGIGLSDSEIGVYLSLLKNGSCLASRISSDTGMNRTHVYELIEKLLEKGIANYVIRENRKYFSVISARNLLNFIEEQKRVLETRGKEIEELIPELEKLKKQQEGVEVEVFKGPEGVKTILNHVVSVGKDNRVFPIIGILFELLPVFYQNYLKRMERNGQHRYLLATEDKRGLYEGTPLVHVRYLPPKFNIPSATWIYGDFVVIFIPEEDLTMIRIHNKAVAENYLNFFNEFWKMSKE
ncbi:Sugar-specific transcriptional regulator TrmB [uncultured archaeon]|nr:Sugar-specific transcriptional regulator TrmB [uncultured archaeon]